MLSTHDRIHSRIQRIQPIISFSSCSLNEFTAPLSACNMAMRRLPKQIEPNEEVIVRKRDPVTADEQTLFASSGSYHHVPSTPATVTCVAFCKMEGTKDIHNNLVRVNQ